MKQEFDSLTYGEGLRYHTESGNVIRLVNLGAEGRINVNNEYFDTAVPDGDGFTTRENGISFSELDELAQIIERDYL